MNANFVQSRDEWLEVLEDANRTINLSSSFPDNPFRWQGYVYFCFADDAFGPEIAQVMSDLARRAGDEHVTALQVAPRPLKAWHREGLWPAFRVTRRNISSRYVPNVWDEPLPINSIGNVAMVFAAWGEKATWALWVQPRWDVLALWVEDSSLARVASWSQIRWMPLDEVVDEVFAPEKQHNKPSTRQRERFRAAFANMDVNHPLGDEVPSLESLFTEDVVAAFHAMRWRDIDQLGENLASEWWDVLMEDRSPPKIRGGRRKTRAAIRRFESGGAFFAIDLESPITVQISDQLAPVWRLNHGLAGHILRGVTMGLGALEYEKRPWVWKASLWLHLLTDRRRQKRLQQLPPI